MSIITTIIPSRTICQLFIVVNFKITVIQNRFNDTSMARPFIKDRLVKLTLFSKRFEKYLNCESSSFRSPIIYFTYQLNCLNLLKKTAYSNEKAPFWFKGAFEN